jgi:hypothetical protein
MAGHGNKIINWVLVESAFKIETAATIDGRYAAESEAEVIGIGGEGRSRRDGRNFGIAAMLPFPFRLALA